VRQAATDAPGLTAGEPGQNVEMTGSVASDGESETAALSEALASVGRAVRDVVRSGRGSSDHLVVRSEGGDDVFGVDARADEVLVEALRATCGSRWPGRLVIEGTDGEVAVGGPGPWVYLADPVDGTRGYLAGLRSAWVLLGAGRDAGTLEELEVGAAVEVPTARAAVAMVASADRSGHLRVEDDDLVLGGPPVALRFRPQSDGELDRRFVTVVRLLAGGHGPIGSWADSVLDGLEVYDDLYPCSGGQLMALATGAAAAVLDPRPLLHPKGLHTHPYDLAALVVARAAGLVVERLPTGPLDVPIDTTTPVAWAAYANETVAGALRARVAAAWD
jgi:fructose-1,6-bisphosphatase/inositol monophosphatase family enzyme